ncbi:MAG: hypothetical protein AMXMBFR34_27610 [Myxococcaceae bacterium]
MRLFVIVEGQGEEAALPVLLRRVAADEGLELTIAGRPWREPRARILAADTLDRVLKVARGRADAGLVVFDADDDCAVELAARVHALAAQLSAGFPLAVAVAVREYEAWFLAAAESLRGLRGLPLDLARPERPEAIRDAKGWLSDRMPQRYSPTLDQPAFTAALSVMEAEHHSRSFRKLLKEVRAMAQPASLPR